MVRSGSCLQGLGRALHERADGTNQKSRVPQDTALPPPGGFAESYLMSWIPIAVVPGAVFWPGTIGPAVT